MKSLKAFNIKALLLTTILFICGCKKDAPEYEIKVVAFNDTKDLMEKGVSIKVFLHISLGKNSILQEATTNEKGEFVFNLERSKAVGLTVVFEKDGFFPETKTISFKDLRTDEVNIIQQNMKMKSYITIRYMNSTSETRAQIFHVNGKTNCEECCINGFEIEPNTSSTCVNNANEPYEILYRVGVYASGTISTVAAPGETAYLDINF